MQDDSQTSSKAANGRTSNSIESFAMYHAQVTAHSARTWVFGKTSTATWVTKTINSSLISYLEASNSSRKTVVLSTQHALSIQSKTKLLSKQPCAK